ncbi:hypothetical protein LXA43DRAFT_1091537 [Ganoderma leucocontextum]|nr:hypothetical protein LXA43DRAFT_1091537 [Ganoderma leucocontextum]
MAPVRVIKGFRDALGCFPQRIGAPKSRRDSSLSKVNVYGQGAKADTVFTNRLTKKFQSRMRRASCFGDHGSSTAFKKVLRRRERVKATALGLPAFPAIPYDFHPQSPDQRQAPAADQPLVSPRHTGSRQTVRESRFAEKHMGVPFSIYLACKFLNMPHRGPIKSIERHGSETRRSRLVLLARAKGSPFRGSKRRAMFMQSSNGFVLGAVFDEHDSRHSSPSPRAGFGVEEVQCFSPLSAVKNTPPAPSQEPLDEMEDVVPAPLIYHHRVSQPVRPIQSLALVQTPTVPAPPVQAVHTPPPAQSSSTVQPPSTVPSAEQILHAQPIQPGHLLPTISYFCRNLGRVSKEMAYLLRALSGVHARERCALPPTTPVVLKTQSSCASAALARLPPAPTKAKLPYTRPSALYAESDG